MGRLLINDDWLRDHQFKWYQLERQENKHWFLWLGDATGKFTSSEDLGIEITYQHYPNEPEKDFWFCWLRADCAGRYHRFIHIRHINYVDELISIIEACTGQKFDKKYLWYGQLVSPEKAEYFEKEAQRLDLRMRECEAKHHAWTQAEKDGDRSLVHEHIDAAIKGGLAK